MKSGIPPRIQVQIPFFYDPVTGLLYAASDNGKPIRTQFFSNEQLSALRIQENGILLSLKTNEDAT